MITKITWREWKAKIESQGITDDTNIAWIDICEDHPQPKVVECHSEKGVYYIN